MSTTKRTLKQIFAQRINQQARQVVQNYQDLETKPGQARNDSEALHSEADKLARMAARAEQAALSKVALNIATLAKQISAQPERREQLKPTLSQLVTELRQGFVRQNDRSKPLAPPKALPGAGAERGCIYLALNNQALSRQLHTLITALGLCCQELNLSTASEIHSLGAPPNKTSHQQASSCIVLDGGIAHAGNLYRSLGQCTQTRLSCLYLSAETPDITTRLQAAQANISKLVSLQSPLYDIVQSITELMQASTPPEHGYRVLVVDDSKSQAYFVQEALTKLGMQVRSLNEPEGCLEIMASFQPDIVLIDMYMPFCSGIELVKILKQVPEYRHLPVIYLSAEEDPLLQQQALSQGGDDFLCKPVQGTALQQKIASLCRPPNPHTNTSLSPSYANSLKHLQRYLAQTPGSELRLIQIAALQDFASTEGLLASERAMDCLALLLSLRLRQSDLHLRINANSFIIALTNAAGEQAADIAEELGARFGELKAMYSTQKTCLQLRHRQLKLSPTSTSGLALEQRLAQLLYCD